MKNVDKRNEREFFEYDERGNCIHAKYADGADGFEFYATYNENGNKTYYVDTAGFKLWKTYNEHGQITSYINTNGYEAY